MLLSISPCSLGILAGLSDHATHKQWKVIRTHGGIQSGVLGGGIYSDAMIRDVEDACHAKLIGAKLVLANFTNVNAKKLLHVVSPVVRQV